MNEIAKAFAEFCDYHLQQPVQALIYLDGVVLLVRCGSDTEAKWDERLGTRALGKARTDTTLAYVLKPVVEDDEDTEDVMNWLSGFISPNELMCVDNRLKDSNTMEGFAAYLNRKGKP